MLVLLECEAGLEKKACVNGMYEAGAVVCGNYASSGQYDVAIRSKLSTP